MNWIKRLFSRKTQPTESVPSPKPELKLINREDPLSGPGLWFNSFIMGYSNEVLFVDLEYIIRVTKRNNKPVESPYSKEFKTHNLSLIQVHSYGKFSAICLECENCGVGYFVAGDSYAFGMFTAENDELTCDEWIIKKLIE